MQTTKMTFTKSNFSEKIGTAAADLTFEVCIPKYNAYNIQEKLIFKKGEMIVISEVIEVIGITGGRFLEKYYCINDTLYTAKINFRSQIKKFCYEGMII